LSVWVDLAVRVCPSALLYCAALTESTATEIKLVRLFGLSEEVGEAQSVVREKRGTNALVRDGVTGDR
jgi:hypothetical protein